jgi:hypothetical protein
MGAHSRNTMAQYSVSLRATLPSCADRQLLARFETVAYPDRDRRAPAREQRA